MKILLHGKCYDKTIVFCCRCCLCTFEAGPGDYKTKTEELGMIHKATCPECGSKVENYSD